MSDYRKKERKLDGLVHDTRPTGEKVLSALLSPKLPPVLMGGLATAVVALPAFAEPIAAVAALIGFATVTAQDKHGLAMMMPKTSGAIDPKQLEVKKPKKKATQEQLQEGRDKAPKVPHPAQGIIYVGNDVHTGEEVWLTDDQSRTHTAVFGTTGSGKTQFLISVAYNALVHGSGFIYIDGKADNLLYGQIYSMCRAFGREDDVLVLNFQTGARDIYGALPVKQSNTLNMLATGTSRMVSELLKALKDSGEEDIWSKQADGFIEALVRPVIYLRDIHKHPLDVDVMRGYFELNKLEELAWEMPKLYPDLEKAGVLDGIRNYLKTKPGYQRENYHKQLPTVHEQHGYIAMQLMQTFGSLADTYRYIMRTPLAEVDFTDVFLNRRILVVMLPAMETSPTELKNLGRICVASLKATMAQGLGSAVEGEWARVISAKPTNAPSPFPANLDEYGLYPVTGFNVVPAQARSLGFAATFAGQDKPGFERESKEEAAQILANTNTKYAGKTSCVETAKYFTDLGGKGRYTVLQRYETDPTAIAKSAYTAERQVAVEQVDRISLESLQAQGSGRWNMIHNDRIVTIDAFYANPTPVKHLRVNHFVEVMPPSTEEVQAFKSSVSVFERAMLHEAGIAAFMDVGSAPADLREIQEGFALFGRKGQDSAVTAGEVLAYCAKKERFRAERFARTVHYQDSASEQAAGPVADFTSAVDFEHIMQNLDAAPTTTAAPSRGPLSNFSTGLVAPIAGGVSEFFSDLIEDAPTGEAAAKQAPGEWVTSAPATSGPATALDPALSMDFDDLAESPRPAQVFDVEHMSPSTNVFGSSVDAPPDFGSQDMLAAADLTVGAPEQDDWSSLEDLDFDPPAADEGHLDRTATQSGIAAIEMALGATRAEANSIATTVAEDLGDITRYPIDPPKKAPSLEEFKSMADDVVALLDVDFGD